MSSSLNQQLSKYILTHKDIKTTVSSHRSLSYAKQPRKSSCTQILNPSFSYLSKQKKIYEHQCAEFKIKRDTLYIQKSRRAKITKFAVEGHQENLTTLKVTAMITVATFAFFAAIFVLFGLIGVTAYLLAIYHACRL